MFQEQKKTKKPTHLIKHDFEVIKPSGKTEKDESRLNIGTDASKCQNCWYKRKKTDQCTPFLSPPVPGEATALMKQWKGRGIEETLSKTVNVDVSSRQGSTQQKAPSHSCQAGASTWHKAFL